MAQLVGFHPWIASNLFCSLRLILLLKVVLFITVIVYVVGGGLVLFSAVSDYGYQIVTAPAVETKPVKETTITTLMVRRKMYTHACCLLFIVVVLGYSDGSRSGVQPTYSGLIGTL